LTAKRATLARGVLTMERLTASALEVPPALLAGLVELVRATVRAEASREGDGDPWVEIAVHLGMSRREAAELARAGHVKGARKLGKRWRAKRSECDAAIERIGVAPPAPSPTPPALDDGEDQGADGVLAELGLARIPVKGKAKR
jgi:hypothetical protein